MHSGNYGNWMPDANVRLAQLISSMVDANGKVIIPGFYSDVLPFAPDALAMMQAVPDQPAKIQAEFGVGSVDGAAASLQEGLNLPTFSVHMMKGGEVVFPPAPPPEIAMRLVRENNPKTMVDRVIAHIRSQGYFIVDHDPDVATLAAHPRIAKLVSRETVVAAAPRAPIPMTRRRSSPPPRCVRLGAPMWCAFAPWAAAFRRAPLIEAIVARWRAFLAKVDDNQHSDNGNLKPRNVFDGIITLTAMMNC